MYGGRLHFPRTHKIRHPLSGRHIAGRHQCYLDSPREAGQMFTTFFFSVKSSKYWNGSFILYKTDGWRSFFLECYRDFAELLYQTSPCGYFQCCSEFPGQCLCLGRGALRNPYLSSHFSSLYCERSPHLKYRTTTVLKTFCVGRKSSLESPTWAQELFTLQDLSICRLCQ